MSSVHELETSDLEVGIVLPFDLRGHDGIVLHKAGSPITQRLLDRLEAEGVTSVCVRGESKEFTIADVLNSFYDPGIIQQITKRLDESVDELGRSIQGLMAGTPIPAELVTKHVGAFVAQVSTDMSAVLAVLSQRGFEKTSNLCRSISEKSTNLSLLCISIAASIGLPPERVVRAGIAALLSDVSLAAHPEWYDSLCRLKPEVYKLDEYRNHSLESMQKLSDTRQFDRDLLECVAQSHELADGSGFPRGLKSHTCMLESRVIGVSEIYCTLTSPVFTHRPYSEPDALAYLVHRAAKGEIDRDVLRGFVKSLSMYPVGSMVVLNDNTRAVVVKPNRDSPFQPIVKQCDEFGRVKDLCQSTERIVGPAESYLQLEMEGQSIDRIRIEKSKLDAILWHPATSLSHGVCPGVERVAKSV
jgi:hypothetical protein